MSSLNNRWKSLLLSPVSLWTALFLASTATGLLASGAKASQSSIDASQRVVSVVPQAPVLSANTQATPAVSDRQALSPRLVASAVASDPLVQGAEIQPMLYAADAQEVEPSVLDQVTSVSQLTDVKPTDWAFQALQSLVERYGCIVGYPNKTYRGNRALTRYEFAAGLNACMDRINELIAAGTADLVKKEDLLAVQKLQEEFAAELATLRGRVGALEARTATLEKQQFSTTTKLNGLVWFNLSGAGASRDVTYEGPASGVNDAANGRFFTTRTNGQPTRQVTGSPEPTFSFLTWLTLNTSFSGKDNLVTQLSAGNGISPINQYASAGFFNAFGAPFTDQTAGTVNGRSDVVIHDLFYSFPVGDSIKVTVGPRVNWYRAFDFNRFTFFLTGSGSFDSIGSTQTNAIDRGSGAIVEWNINKQFRFAAAYLGENTEFLPSQFGFNTSSSPTFGLFGGTNTATAELTFSPSSTLNFRFLYNYSRIQAYGGQVGGAIGEPIPYGYVDAGPGFSENGVGGGLKYAYANTFTFNFDWLITPGFGIFGRYGFGNTNLKPIDKAVDVQSFQVGVGFPDLLKKGALGVVTFLMPMDIIRGDRYFAAGAGDGGTMYELEASYFYPLTDNIALVPAFYAIFNANNFDSNPTIFVGNLRAQFSF
ncbi:iron uptake porin [Stenomitos frigidus]|uniref:Porin n=1 Tax=Stenomitos frigidus ULC18 TaxID=2107698 RepID=A0A2T1DVR6_9CYAN|nr:iron uptake porin [Stenomitos frigidus]PSB24603.1 porin [Stenomitos frigidus ULC18]